MDHPRPRRWHPRVGTRGAGPTRPRTPGPIAGAKELESSPPAGFRDPTSPRRQGSPPASPPAARPARPAPPCARVCCCASARGEGVGVLPGRRVPVGAAAGARDARGRARRAGRASASSAPPPGLANRIGSRRRERARARRVEPGGGRARRRRRPRRSAGRRARGGRRRPPRLPAKRPYLSGHCLSLPGGRLGAADPLPPGSSSPGAAEGAGQAGARGAAGPCRPGQHLGRLPASPAPMPGSP